LTRGPRLFGSLDEMVDAAVKAAGGRSAASLEIGVRHNAQRLEDGTWTWRYDVLRAEDDPPMDFSPLWQDVEAIAAPMMLVRGGASFHVPDEHADEFEKRRPGLRVEIVDGARHSVQSDRPVELAALIDDFVFSG
jgi:pimeloyl-ACP methyl ester carboxylesterase